MLADAMVLPKPEGENSADRSVPDEGVGICELPLIARSGIQHTGHALARFDVLARHRDVLVSGPKRVLSRRAVAEHFLNGYGHVRVEIGADCPELFRPLPQFHDALSRDLGHGLDAPHHGANELIRDLLVAQRALIRLRSRSEERRV